MSFHAFLRLLQKKAWEGKNKNEKSCKLLWTTPLNHLRALSCEQHLWGPEGFNLVDHGNWFYAVYWQRTMRSINCFLPHQKILSHSFCWLKVAPMCHSITCEKFSCNFPIEMIILKPQSQNMPTIFLGSSWYLAGAN